MTKVTRDEILELRRAGIGYREIADAVGEPRDAVRYICKSRGLGGMASEWTSKNRRVCANCNSYMGQPKCGRARKFCCEECRREWWRKHPDKSSKCVKAVCKRCGKEFIAYGHSVYCSRDCFIQASYWEK